MKTIAENSEDVECFEEYVARTCDGTIDVNGWIGGFSNDGYEGAAYYMWLSTYPDEGSLAFKSLEDALKYALDNSQISED